MGFHACQCQLIAYDISLWERSAAECLIDFQWLEKYLVSRGGRAKPTPIEPSNVEWPDNPVEPVEPCKEALLVEKRLLGDLERLCTLADKSGDSSLADVIQRKFLRKEAKHVKDFADLLQQVVRVSKQPGLGIYLVDRELRLSNGSVPWATANDPDRQEYATEQVRRSIKEGLSL